MACLCNDWILILCIISPPPEITSQPQMDSTGAATPGSTDGVFYALTVAVSVVGGAAVVVIIAILIGLAIIIRRRRSMSPLPRQQSPACHMTDYTSIKTKGSQLSCSSATSTNSSEPSGDLPLNTDLFKYLGTSV